MTQQATTIVAAQPLAINLHDEIGNIIKLYAYGKKAPPFSPAELAVMAWVCCRDRQGVISEEQIFRWVTDTFKYYAELATEDAYILSRWDKFKCPPSSLRGLGDGLATEPTLHHVPMFSVSKKLAFSIAQIPAQYTCPRYPVHAHSFAGPLVTKRKAPINSSSFQPRSA